ncbi:MAG: amino acid permease [Oscillospiraceae bacterium]|nr:amino acid permease [Oscillospiraceae bacterium]
MDNRNDQVKMLDRYLSPLDVWSMAFGCMVGWGVMVMPGTTFLPVAGPAGTLISLVIGLAVMLTVAHCVSYLMVRSPSTGGIYSYTKEAFGRDHAFLCSWFLSLSYLTVVFLNGTAVFLVVRTMLGNAAHGSWHYVVGGNTVYFREVACSVVALAGIGVLFIVAKPILQRLQTILAVVLIAGIIVTAGFCIPHALSGGQLWSFGFRGVSRPFAIFSLVILAPWAFVGFEVITLDTAHFRFPIKKTGAVLFISIIAAAFAYIAMALVAISAMPDGYGSWVDYISDIGNLSGVESVPTFYAARSIMGQTGFIMLGVTAIAAILTGIIGAYRAMLRMLSTMAEDNILSKSFEKTSYSILFVMTLSILISLLGRNTLSWFVDLTSFGAIVAYGYTSAAAYKIAKAEGNTGIKVTGIAGTVISVVFCIVQLVPNLAALDAMGSEAFLLLSLWCLLGFIFYWRTVKRSTLAEYSGMSTSGTVLFALLVYAAIIWLGKRLAARQTIEEVRSDLSAGGILMILIIFVGLIVMLYIQNLVRTKNEAAEREKIRAVESSLAKSQFLFNMSHDIRTPMNAILGYTNLALKDPTSDTQKDYLEKIETSSEHLLALINDILEMSRIESGKMELNYAPADLIKIFEEMRDLFSAQMKQKRLYYSVYTEQVHDRYIWCDRKNLNRVLLNIISNAYKFTPEGGTISVSAYETGSAESGYGSYELRVKDSGIGMSKEFVEKMWGAFERERTSTDSGIEGTGLGLAITKSLVELMGGTIEALTSPGSGTEIIIRVKFRLASEDDLKKETGDGNSEAADETDFSGKRLLLVEDNEINMEIARMILEQMGFAVETAENGKIAVDMVGTSEPGYYDAVLMDIQMPVMNGYEATRAIRTLQDPLLAGIPILAMTANAFEEDVLAARDAGMQSHIAKPIDIGVLTEELRSVLDRR